MNYLGFTYQNPQGTEKTHSTLKQFAIFNEEQ